MDYQILLIKKEINNISDNSTEINDNNDINDNDENNNDNTIDNNENKNDNDTIIQIVK